MHNYFELFLLAILVSLIYKKPIFLENIMNNKIYLVLLICLNAYIAKEFGIASGIIMALISIILLDTKETFCNVSEAEEESEPKVNVQTWRPASFTAPCQTENDRILKIRSEVSTLNASK
tara:strand:+ start:12953 stop:13312 length:360 start_codon:yes stop_codon:yes gene_type:complete